MTDRVFIDTNVLVYARDGRNADKRHRARGWLAAITDSYSARTNLQVLNELTRWILRNESSRPLGEIQDEIAALRGWGDRPLDGEELDLAWAVRDKLGYQWFDCLLVAAAHVQGCRYFLTEDMAHGASFQGVTLINPFRLSPDELFLRN
ncbi:PIN domain-containing protein [Methylobacterium symbioticum]|nr:PIN domain-containing protein [Methylobacterium symbioticum]